ncbi:MAG: hypothetical protein LBR98_04540 [Syntrophomonadaceae bacterium]|jgi:hypothetical protein|nr:hypothetical protein [Syntrophomonadaceae bacterium]
MSITQQITFMIERLSLDDQRLLLDLAKRLISDDVATPDDLEAIAAGREEYRQGKTEPLASVNLD